MLNSLLSSASANKNSVILPLARLDASSISAVPKVEAQSVSSTETDTITLSQEAQNFLLLNTLNIPTNRALPSSDEVFAKTDTDEDGLVSEEEFVDARPGFASEEQAAEKFAVIDTDGDGLVTQTEIEASNDGATATTQTGADKPPPPPPPLGGGKSVSLSDLYDELDTNEDGVVDINELLVGLEEANEEKAARTGQQDDPSATLLQKLSQAAQSYSAYNNVNETESILFDTV